MKARPNTQSGILILVSVAAAVLVGFVAVHYAGQPIAPSKEAAEVPQELSDEGLAPPSLDCAFHNFTRTAAVVSFYFDVAILKGEAPRFFERAIVSADGKRTNFTGNDRPAWTYGLDDDGKPTITSHDGATRIVLYGLKLGTPGVLSVEAGIRSNEYRNLGGECRQTSLGGSSD
ncbi:MAG: hypothetical protein WDN31_22810 [Hyphomicrobium sp.]